MPFYTIWVSLNDEGKKLWGDIFQDGRVPICGITDAKAQLEGEGEQRVFLVQWTALTDIQQAAILNRLSERFHAPKEVILKDIRQKGLPLRVRYTTETVAMHPALFI